MVYKTGMEMDKRALERKLYGKFGSYEVNSPEGGFESLQAEFLDISSSGACIRTEREHRPGSVLMLRFEVEGSGVRIPCLAEVRWANTDNSRYKVGLQFLT